MGTKSIKEKLMSFAELRGMVDISKADFQKNKLLFDSSVKVDMAVHDETQKAADKNCVHGFLMSKILAKYKVGVSATPYNVMDDYVGKFILPYRRAYMEDGEMCMINFFILGMNEIIVKYYTDNGISANDFTFEKFIKNEIVLNHFLDYLCYNEGYPFCSEYARNQNKNCIVFVDSVECANILEKNMKDHLVIGKYYKIINIAGSDWARKSGFGHVESTDIAERLNDRIYENEKKGFGTIFISCGRCGVAVTMKRLTTVMFLSNCNSRIEYEQEACRANTSFKEIREEYDKNNQKVVYSYVKSNSYVYDFAPNRTLSTVVIDYFSDYNKRGDVLTEQDLASKEFKNAIRKVLDCMRFFSLMHEGAVMQEMNFANVFDTCANEIRNRYDNIHKIYEITEDTYMKPEHERKEHTKEEYEAAKESFERLGVSLFAKNGLSKNVSAKSIKLANNLPTLKTPPAPKNGKLSKSVQKVVNEFRKKCYCAKNAMRDIIARLYLFAISDDNYNSNLTFEEYLMSINDRDFLDYIGKFSSNNKNVSEEQALKNVKLYKHDIIVIMKIIDYDFVFISRKITKVRSDCRELISHLDRFNASREMSNIFKKFTYSTRETVLTTEELVKEILTPYFDRHYHTNDIFNA